VQAALSEFHMSLNPDVGPVFSDQEPDVIPGYKLLRDDTDFNVQRRAVR
jgi:hypothetical protein